MLLSEKAFAYDEVLLMAAINAIDEAIAICETAWTRLPRERATLGDDEDNSQRPIEHHHRVGQFVHVVHGARQYAR